MIIRNLLVIGSGTMGSGIALVAALSGKLDSVVVFDVSHAALDTARRKLQAKLEEMVDKSVLLDTSALGKITWTSSMDKAIARNLLVVEAVPEILELKQNIFRQLSDFYHDRDDVILATNTSALSCKEISVHVINKKCFAGLHFSNPVEAMRLVEIIRTTETDEVTMSSLCHFVKSLGKVSVSCKDEKGFIFNRLVIPYLMSAVQMVETGVATPEDIDTTMKLGAGHPLGPLELVDLIGVDTCMDVNHSYVDTNGNRIPISKVLTKMIQEGKLGRKTGEGFYKYKVKEIKSKL